MEYNFGRIRIHLDFKIYSAMVQRDKKAIGRYIRELA